MAAAKKTAPRADLVDKDPSETHIALAAFITEQTGYEPDLKTLQLRSALYRPFIKSDEHAKRLATSKADREQAEAEKEERRAKRAAAAKEKADKPAPAKKTAAKKAAPAKKTAAKKAAAPKASADEPF